MNERVMVDIETLGTSVGCVILSIGAVRFDHDGVGDEFYRNVSLQSCQDAGLSVDAETLEWWLGQNDDAKHALTGGMSLGQALLDFATFYGDAKEVWANSPAFDVAILEDAYERLGIEPPWQYYETRDVRTVSKLPGAVDVERDDGDVEHDARDDARYQAGVVAANLRRLREVSSHE